jgi:hypothetical protein
MKTISLKEILLLTGIVVLLTAGLTGTFRAEAKPDAAPKPMAVTGSMDWSIVPPNLPAYVIPGTDGDLYLRNMPLVGRFQLTGERVSIDAKLSVQLSGELDATGTGVLWAPAIVTATIGGVKTIIFEGPATADTVGLVSVGEAALRGRGPYEGSTLEFTFEEIEPGNSDTYTVKGQLSPARP